jgi:hypothetical protein
MAEESAEALQWLRDRLDRLVERYPELTTAREQERLEAELDRQAAEEGSDHDTDTNG